MNGTQCYTTLQIVLFFYTFCTGFRSYILYRVSQSPCSTTLQSPRGTPLQSPCGTPLQSPRGTTLQSPRGTPLQSPCGTPLWCLNVAQFARILNVTRCTHPVQNVNVTNITWCSGGGLA